jgi:hypothetical protein
MRPRRRGLTGKPCKIDRGEEVKLETLQQVANKLQVTEEYFRHPPAAEVTANDDVVPEPGTVMLRKLDGAHLEQLLKGANRLEWELNAQVRDEETGKFLEDFETAVEKFLKDLFLFRGGPSQVQISPYGPSSIALRRRTTSPPG